MKTNPLTTTTKKTGTAWIGTSNIVVPVTKKDFPETFQSASRLAYYASLFNSVEINSSFYKVPMPSTFEKWSNEVPDNFQFTVKLWRDVTHAKNLVYDAASIDSFMKAANQVSNKKKGCLLIQFPAGISGDNTAKLEALLKRVQLNDAQMRWRKCVEFRHTSWYNADVYAILDAYNTSMVLHDMPASKISTLHTKANFVYTRFHGVEGDYKGTYDDDLLKEHAAKIKNWQQHGKDVYTYFNNTIGNAFENAQHLAGLLKHHADKPA